MPLFVKYAAEFGALLLQLNKSIIRGSTYVMCVKTFYFLIQLKMSHHYFSKLCLSALSVYFSLGMNIMGLLNYFVFVSCFLFHPVSIVLMW